MKPEEEKIRKYRHGLIERAKRLEVQRQTIQTEEQVLWRIIKELTKLIEEVE